MIAGKDTRYTCVFVIQLDVEFIDTQFSLGV